MKRTFSLIMSVIVGVLSFTSSIHAAESGDVRIVIADCTEEFQEQAPAIFPGIPDDLFDDLPATLIPIIKREQAEKIVAEFHKQFNNQITLEIQDLTPEEVKAAKQEIQALVEEADMQRLFEKKSAKYQAEVVKILLAGMAAVGVALIIPGVYIKDISNIAQLTLVQKLYTGGIILGSAAAAGLGLFLTFAGANAATAGYDLGSR